MSVVVQTGGSEGAEGNQTARIHPLPLPLILLVAFALRAWGINWGLPSSSHYFSYHPDEVIICNVVIQPMNVLAGQWLPHFYNYGSLQIYLVDLIGSLFGGRSDPYLYTMLLIGRLITAIMGTASVWLVYLAGRELWNERAGLLASIALTIMPLHAQHSHWLTVDVPATFWICLAVYLSARLMRGGTSTWLLLSAGLAAGFAAATKYNAGLALLPVLFALLPQRPKTTVSNVATPIPPDDITNDDAPVATVEEQVGDEARCTESLGQINRTEPSSWPASIGRMAIACAVCGLGFLIGCPGSVLENAKFVSGLQYELQHVGERGGETFANTGSGFVYQIVTNLQSGVGWPLLLLALLAVGYALSRRAREDALLAIFALPYYIIIGLAVVRYARYVIPLLPFLALWTGRMAANLLSSQKSGMRLAAQVACIVVAVATLARSIWLIAPMAGVDPRDRALAWIDSRGLRGAATGFAVQPSFQTPPIYAGFGTPGWGNWRKLIETQLAASQNSSNDAQAGIVPNWQSIYLFQGDWDQGLLDIDKPSVVLLSWYDYRDGLRIHREDVESFLAKLRSEYRVGAEFGGYGPAVMNGNGLPHDMTYANPATWVFVRK